MRKIRNKLCVTFLGFQVLIIGPIIAESVSGIGSEEVSQEQAALVIDSLHTQEPPGTQIGETMVATYYSKRFHGRRTSNGEVYDQNLLTCAHKSLPFNTKLIVTNPKNGKAVVVRVNDRGPFTRGRDIDLSYAAAQEIGIIRAGVAPVEVVVLHPENSERTDNLAIR